MHKNTRQLVALLATMGAALSGCTTDALSPHADSETNSLPHARPAVVVLSPNRVLTAVGDTSIAGLLGGERQVSLKVTDTLGLPLHNVVVYFKADVGSGNSSSAVANSLTSGIAKTTWRYGTTIGTQVMRAWLKDGTDTVVFRANVPGPSQMSAVSATTLQGAYQGSAVVTVLVVDSLGDAFPNATVRFVPDSGSGKVSYAAVKSSLRGEAKTTWSYALTGGEQTLRVTLDGTDDTLTFTADVDGPPVPDQLTPGSSVTMTGITGRTTALYAIVLDQEGRPLPNALVNFQPNTGSGTVNPASIRTSSRGEARVNWTFGLTVGEQRLRVTAQGTGDTLTYVATVKAPPVASELVVDSLGPIVGKAGERQVVVFRVNDADGDPFPNAVVRFRVIDGRGTINASLIKSASNGKVRVTWTFGGIIGAQSLSGEIVGTTLPPRIIDTVTTSAGDAAVVRAVAGNDLSAEVGDTLTQAPVVKVTDRFGNPVPNATVTFTVTRGGGAVRDASVQTDSSGLASAGAWTMGAVAGVNYVVAAVTGVGAINGNPVTFKATGRAP